VIKIGGALIEQLGKTAEAVRDAGTDSTVLVHGGGIQITRLLERFGVASKFVDGLRVTDEITLPIAAMALVGDVHTQLIRVLKDFGIPAIGLFGTVAATQRPGPLGFVGGEVRVDHPAIEAILDARRVPVIPTFALGNGTLLNVNGDETAAAMAIALRADRLIFMTDVAGVKDAGGNVIDFIQNPKDLLGANFISGGMIPKLRSVAAAIAGGVATVYVGRTRFGRV
jgi:acetylglutamate kinase